VLDAVRSLVTDMCTLGVSVLRALYHLAGGYCRVDSLFELIHVNMMWSEYGHEVVCNRAILWRPDVMALRIEGNRYFQRGQLHCLPPAGRAFAWKPLGRRTLDGIS
jgi:hypothetical protein